jgi:hypothetical protein
LEKIAAHEAAQAGNGGNTNDAPVPIDEDFEIPAKVVEVYSKYDYPVQDNLQLLTRWQNWSDIITIQIRKIAKTVQNPADRSPLGGHYTNNSTRKMDSKRMLRSNQNFRVKYTNNSTTIYGDGNP